MEKTNFTTVSLEGYRSYQNREDIKLNRPGINILQSPNGQGKTTMFDGLYWTLYGVNMNGLNLDKLQTWEWIRDTQYQGIRGVVVWEKGGHKYRVVRHYHYKGSTAGKVGGDKLMLFVNGEMWSEGLHKEGVQEEIVRILGMSDRVFINSIIFGQRMARLINADNDTKRKLFEEIFDLVFVPRAKEKAAANRVTLQTKISALDIEISSLTRSINQNTESRDDKKQQAETWEADKKVDLEASLTKLNEYTAEYEKYKAEVKQLKKDIKKAGDPISTQEATSTADAAFKALQAKQGEISKAERQRSNWKEEVDKATRKVSKLQDDIKNPEDTCPTCEQKLPKAKVNTVLKSLRENLKTEKEVLGTAETSYKKEGTNIAKLTEEAEELQKSHDDSQKVLSGLQETNQSRQQLVGSLEIAENNESNADRNVRTETTTHNQIKDREGQVNDFPAMDKVIKEETDRLGTKSRELEAYQDDMNYTKFWSAKGFGADGVKAYVFSAMLSKLNMVMEQYSSRLGGRVLFTIDLSKANKPFTTTVYRDTHAIEYDELSGGQKQRIDICLAFAMHDLVNQAGAFNLLVMDEVMEGLDEEGVSQVFELIRSKVQDNDSVYVISHLNTVDTKGSKHMSVNFDGKTSRVS